MHLKEIRMENFKSFGRSLRVPLLPGFTAVTGPNGAGKSNIADAILFVLGPSSSRVIRAQRLTDLIFNGGKNAKPAKECEVSLVFDNGDRMLPLEADEVILTRRIRRAPKRGAPDNNYSYFYINGRAASLKEFIDLLRHARISADGYNIVTQGAITHMVEMSNVERRQVLDSIAGITEFDEDIEKADKKRVEAEQNLERVNIIIGEIRRSLGDLKKERDDALKYAEIKKRQDQLKGVLAYRQKEELDRQLAAIHDEIKGREEEKKEIIARLEEARLQLKEALKNKQDLEGRLADLAGPGGDKTREEIKTFQADAVRFEERLNYAKDEIKELGAEKRALETETNRLDKELERLDAEATRLKDERVTWAERLKRSEKELKEIRDMISHSDEGSFKINQELAKLKTDHEETETKLHALRLEVDRYGQNKGVVEHRVAELEEARQTAEFEIKDIDFQVKSLKEGSKATTANVKSAERELLDHHKKQAKVTEELTTLEGAIRRLQTEFHGLQAREEASSRVGQGLNRAVDAVLQARGKGQLKGIHGTIADLGKAKEGKFETALEIAAGNRMMSVVVEDDEAAAKAIEFLKANKLGRAAFLPINKMAPVKPRGKALMVVKEADSFGFALDLIEFSAKYENAFAYVFGDTVVVKDLAGARRMMGGVRLVTLEGELLEPSGAMIGGSLSGRSELKFAGKDVARLAEVEAELATAMAHQEKLTEELIHIRKRIGEVEAQIGKERTSADGELKLRDFETRRKEFESKLKLLEDELASKRRELTGLEDGAARGTERIEALEKHLKELETGRKDKSRLLLKGTKKEWAESATKAEDAIQESQKKALEAESAAATAEKAMALVKERLGEVAKRLQKTLSGMAQFEVDAEKAKSGYAEIDGKLKILTKAETAMTGESRDLQGRRDKAADKVAELEKRTDTLLTKIDTTDSLITASRNRLPTLEETLGEAMMALGALGVTKEPTDAPSLSDCKAELQQIESKMRALEPVNMRALEEFEKQEAREKDLIGEIARLNEQRDNLLKVVEEIVGRKKEGLMKIFSSVNDNFRRVYARLTDGGDAYLELENPERPFDAGLLMKARPKGKKVLRLQALSGGEKSMAALAFIFSIQEFQPSPFYVLDEIDMFLDGVNSELVGVMIKENSRTTQFIIISLRKVTLKAADHIYGVTMAGDGLSQMIANFDISLVTETGELVNKGKGGGATLEVTKAGAEADGATATGKSIGETVKAMMKVEVGK